MDLHGVVVMKATSQYCEICREHLGWFDHDRRREGALVCGKDECDDALSDRDRRDLAERRQAADDADYFGGGL